MAYSSKPVFLVLLALMMIIRAAPNSRFYYSAKYKHTIQFVLLFEQMRIEYLVQLQP